MKALGELYGVGYHSVYEWYAVSDVDVRTLVEDDVDEAFLIVSR